MPLTDHQIDIIQGINAIPSQQGDNNHPNASLLCSLYNTLAGEAETRIAQNESDIATNTGNISTNTTNIANNTTNINANTAKVNGFREIPLFTYDIYAYDDQGSGGRVGNGNSLIQDIDDYYDVNDTVVDNYFAIDTIYTADGIPNATNFGDIQVASNGIVFWTPASVSVTGGFPIVINWSNSNASGSYLHFLSLVRGYPAPSGGGSGS